MYALYDDNGDFKVGTILSEADASLQMETLHGKRAKIKASHVLLRFKAPAPGELMPAAQAVANDIDVQFLWEASGEEEFAFDALAREYFGREPSPADSTGILLKLHNAPVYFHRKGRGRYRAAPAEILKAALAAVEKKRLQQEVIDQWVVALTAGTMPDAIRPMLRELLYKPDRNRPETKAIEQACTATGLSTAKLLEHCGALGPSHDYHFGRFLFDYFPRGIAPPALAFAAPGELPHADVAAFSIDDAATTEIDDAFSLTPQSDGTLRLGIHIAAPGLAFAAESPAGVFARERLSTVYMPGNKITMLPDPIVQAYSLDAGSTRPALSLYLDLDPESFEIRSSFSRLEAVPVAANLRHQAIDALNAVFEAGPDAPLPELPYASELRTLFAFANVLAEARGETNQSHDRAEYMFYVVDDRIQITERKRGSPIDKLVAEMMILVNRTWGKLLADNDVAAIYRVQSQGKVRMTTAEGEHQGLGVSHYAWSSSPLRRFVDLVNQWQLIALLDGTTPPFERNSASLLGAIRDFELTYSAYGEFQDRMEHYWCLRWLAQEGVVETAGTVVRDNVVKFRDLPLYVRVPSLPDLPPGSGVQVAVTAVDLIDSSVEVVFKSRLGGEPLP